MGQSGWWLAVLLDQLKPLFDWSTKSSGLFVNTFPLFSTKWAQIQIYNIWTGQIILPVNFDMFLNIEFQTLLSYSLCNRCGLKQFVLSCYDFTITWKKLLRVFAPVCDIILKVLFFSVIYWYFEWRYKISCCFIL